jgi:hypothetical protein
MVTPPISLRIRRSAEATRSARRLLRELDEKDRLERQIKHAAARAICAIHKLEAVAAPKLCLMSHTSAERWTAEMRKAVEILKRVGHGV